MIDGSDIVEVGAIKDIFPTQGQDVQVIDASGQIIMPGMIDAHVHHTLYEGDANPPEASNSLEYSIIRATRISKLLLESGFTTTRETGTRSPMFAIALRDAINDGIIVGPRIRASGQTITTTGGLSDWGPPWVKVENSDGVIADGIDQIIKEVRRQVKNGVDNIKTDASGTAVNPYVPGDVVTASSDELIALVAEAHRKGKTVAIHAEATQAIKNAIMAKPETIEHAVGMDDEAIEMLLKSKIIISPTMGIYIGGMHTGDSTHLFVKRQTEAHRRQVEGLRKAHAAGVKICMGSDCGPKFWPHGSNAKELEFYVRYLKLTNMEAIVACTKNGAEALKLDREIGTLERGKIGDLLVMNGNPLEDIGVLQKRDRISWTLKDGKIVCRGGNALPPET